MALTPSTRKFVDEVADACDATNRITGKANAKQHMNQVVTALEARNIAWFGDFDGVELTDDQWAKLVQGAQMQRGSIDAER